MSWEWALRFTWKSMPLEAGYQVVHAIEAPEQGALPGAGRPDNGGYFMVYDIQSDTRHYEIGPVIHAELYGLEDGVGYYH